MSSIFLEAVQQKARAGPAGEQFAAIESQGFPVPQILYLFAYQPEMTQHLNAFTHALMRGPSPLEPGLRELIAAFTSNRNQCPF